MDSNLTPLKGQISSQILSYLLAGVTGAVGILNWFKLREVQKAVVTHSGASIWSWQAIDNFTFLGLGIIWLCIVLFSQYYYEKGCKKKRVWKNFFLITGIQLLLLFLSYLPAVLLGNQNIDVSLLLYIGAQFITGAGLLFFAFYRPSKTDGEKPVKNMENEG